MTPDRQRARHTTAEASELTVRLDRTFHAPVTALWDAWTDAAQLAVWFNDAPRAKTTVHELDVRPGGRFRLTIPPDTAPDPSVGSYVGLYLTVKPREELGMTVIDIVRWASAMVRVRFEADGRNTRLILESSLPNEAFRDMTLVGWTACFDHLEAHLAHNDTE